MVWTEVRTRERGSEGGTGVYTEKKREGGGRKSGTE